MPECYKYDFYLSFSHKGNVLDWVKNHFYPVLYKCLEDFLPKSPEIFVDWQLEVGADWPDNMSAALHRSRYLIAIWSPPYFQSRWCLAEWHTLLAREEMINLNKEKELHSLIYPIIFSDGEHFPARAQNTQAQKKLSNYTIPYPVFRNTEEYVKFHKEMMQIAKDLAKRLPKTPEWNPSWPIRMPDPEPSPPASLPRL